MNERFRLDDYPLPNGTLIEASAGTGKTYSVAAHVTLAIATDESLRIGNILVTTYTRNAAAELRDRIRGRMVLSAGLLRGRDATGQAPDPLDAALLAEAAGRLVKARRLERAIAEFDTATIGTIHSICSRVLRLAGFEASDTGDEDLRMKVVDEVVNDAVVAEAAHGRLWDERRLQELVTAHLGDPFVVNWFDAADRTADETAALRSAAAIIDSCVTRVHERMRGSPSFDDLLRRAWEEVRRDDLPGRRFRDELRRKFRLAIVDESQDTSRLQWEFLHEIFPPDGDRPLIAVGDPKQAIYGFRGADVTAYLRFSQRGVADDGTGPPRRTLTVNRRSDGPLIEGLNRAMEGATFGTGISYQRVTAADDRATAAIGPVRPVEFVDVENVSLSEAAVRKVHELLTAARFETPMKRPVRPEDVCVLVRINALGGEIGKRLTALGIPAVTAGTASVMASQMAEDLRILLEAMERPSHAGRARRAAATAFFGASLTDVACLGDAREQAVQGRLATLHATLQQRGIAAMAAEMMADSEMARRLAEGIGGERRIVDVAHVVELLHDASDGKGCHARVMLERFVELAAMDEKGELVSRRIESDADAVKIMSVHAAKGLEYPCVVVADEWKAKDTRRQRGPAVFYEGDERRLDVGLAIPGIGTSHLAKMRVTDADNDEFRRLVYVAVTRPRHHLCVLRRTGWQDSLLAAVMPNMPESAAAVTADDASRLAVRTVHDLPRTAAWRPRESGGTGQVFGTAPISAEVRQTYRRTSFSGITAEAARRTGRLFTTVGRGHDEERFEDADGNADTAADPTVESFTIADLPAGTAFGSAVHEIFERIELVPDADAAAIAAAVGTVVAGVASSHFLRAHHGPLGDMIATSLRTPFGGLPGSPFRDLTFADFAPTDRLTEMDFEMGLAGLDQGVLASDVGRVMKAFLPPSDPLAEYADTLTGPTFDVPLAGLINGSIDAVLRLPGRPAGEPRLIIADYKTNRLHEREAAAPLAAYAPAKLVAAMAHHHYPLQALVYGTAVWRMLRWRLAYLKPEAWDPAECIAGVVYGFVRGMKGPTTPADAEGRRHGVFTWQPPVGIWRRLSELFAGDLTGVRS
jgi:exodeoxyribonuclease V beta subunit